MTEWTNFNLVFENLVQYFTGSYSILALFFVGAFMFALMTRGFDFRYASLLSMPLLGLFVLIGWFGVSGASSFVLNAALIVVGVFYSIAMVRMTT